MSKQKLTACINKFRVSEETLDIIKKIAEEHNRDINEVARMSLDKIADDYKKGKVTRGYF